MAFENLRDRWERLAPRERRMFTLLGVTAVVCVFGFIGLQINDGLRAIEARNGEAKQALHDLDQHRDEYKAKQGESSSAIPDQAPDLPTYLETIAKEVGVSIPEQSERQPVTKGAYEELAVDIKLRGVTIDQLAQFLKKVETRSTSVVTQRLYVKTYFNQHEKLDVELTVATWQKKKGGGGGGGGGGEGNEAGGAAPAEGEGG